MTEPPPHPFAASADEDLAGPQRPAWGTLDWRQTIGGALIGLGLVAVVLAWWGISGAADPAEQMPYFASGGVGGAALVAIGIAMLVSYEHARDRAAMKLLFDEIQQLKRLHREPAQLDTTSVENAPPVKSTSGHTTRKRAPRTKQLQ